jgi:nitroimidazol reductase NimA-like FMN-containing flavoprotein (pyridoxamine 5'-phosphate oxidase superfamily)
MRAHVGDKLVIEGRDHGRVRRVGEIVGLHNVDGTPPYDVRWSDTREVTLVFPGPDARIEPVPGAEPGEGAERPDRDSGPRSPQVLGDRQYALHEDPEQGGVRIVAAGSGDGDRSVNPGDIGRRVAAERRRRGLSRAEVARRARMSTGYLAYLEEQPADPTMTTLVRVADALGTTATALLGAGTEQPPGQGHALLHPVLRDLDEQECRRLLSSRGVGRIAVTTREGRPAVVPVNYGVVDDAIVFRTAPQALPAAAVGAEVAFEVDHVDDTMSVGWSVLAVGLAEAVTDPGEAEDLARRTSAEPWAGGERDLWIRIRPGRLTGRRITPAGRTGGAEG